MGVLLAAIVLTLSCAAAYELGCTFWVYYCEKNMAGPAVLFSMFNAVVTIVGVESFLRSLALKVTYVLGFGLGTWLALRLKMRLFKKSRGQCTGCCACAKKEP